MDESEARGSGVVEIIEAAGPGLPLDSEALQGDEHIAGTDSTVLDFWRFAMSDLRMNNTRGYFAEYLVARAVGSVEPHAEWDSYDVLTPAGVAVEVKSAGYLQVWRQQRLSHIQFRGLSSKRWMDGTGRATTRTHHADVYVFCLQTAQVHDAYNPLDVDQWEFYVLPVAVLLRLAQGSIGLGRLRRLAGAAMTYQGLAKAIADAVVVREGNC